MDSSTNSANSKRRVIRVSKRGAYYIMKDGKKQYSPTAKFIKTPAGGMRVITPANKVPEKIAPKARAPRGPREGKLLRQMFEESEKMEKARKQKERERMFMTANPLFRP